MGMKALSILGMHHRACQAVLSRSNSSVLSHEALITSCLLTFHLCACRCAMGLQVGMIGMDAALPSRLHVLVLLMMRMGMDPWGKHKAVLMRLMHTGQLSRHLKRLAATAALAGGSSFNLAEDKVALISFLAKLLASVHRRKSVYWALTSAFLNPFAQRVSARMHMQKGVPQVEESMLRARMVRAQAKQLTDRAEVLEKQADRAKVLEKSEVALKLAEAKKLRHRAEQISKASEEVLSGEAVQALQTAYANFSVQGPRAFTHIQPSGAPVSRPTEQQQQQAPQPHASMVQATVAASGGSANAGMDQLQYALMSIDLSMPSSSTSHSAGGSDACGSMPMEVDREGSLLRSERSAASMLGSMHTGSTLTGSSAGGHAGHEEEDAAARSNMQGFLHTTVSAMHGGSAELVPMEEQQSVRRLLELSCKDIELHPADVRSVLAVDSPNELQQLQAPCEAVKVVFTDPLKAVCQELLGALERRVNAMWPETAQPPPAVTPMEIDALDNIFARMSFFNMF